MTSYHSSTLQQALYLAIKEQRKTEAVAGYTGPSAVLATWEQMLKELQAGEQIQIRSE
jgi:hypothetical protein